MGECLKFGIESVPQTASAWVKRSKARVPFTSWCCNIVIANGSRVMIMGVTYSNSSSGHLQEVKNNRKSFNFQAQRVVMVIF